MKRVVLFFVFLLAAAGVRAQGMELVREELARPDAFSGARVRVAEQSDAAAAMRSADNAVKRTRTMTHGVSLFRDNSQNAGDNARAVERQFAEMFPDIPVRVSYKSPWFEVAAGHFIDRTDAVALWGKVLSRFPKAVVAPAEMLISDIIEMQNPAPSPAENENNQDSLTIGGK